MKTLRIACVAALLVGVAGWAYFQAAPAPARPLAEVVPAGPLLYLEAKDFSAIVRDWNASPEKEAWLKSDNYAVFARSHLLLRLSDAQNEFAAAAGIPPDMALVSEVAGSESALALYDIGKLEFLYVTRLPAARAAETALWRARGDYQPRSAAGSQYFVKVDPASRRTVAFAACGDYLLLATREDLVAGALMLLAGQPGAAVGSERWFGQSVKAAGPSGDLRLVMNLDAILRTPHFRSSWIQNNVSELRPYSSAVSDLHRSAGEYREERVFLRAPSAAADAEAGAPARESEDAAVAALLPFVPESCGLYRAWAAPTVDDAVALLEQKILLPRTGAPPASKEAPGVYLSGGVVGSEADLETRIDEPPLPDVRSGVAAESLRKLFQDARLQGLLQLQSTREVSGFVATPSALVFQSSTDWNSQAVQDALVPAVETLWSTSRLGLRWVEKKQGAVSYSELDGLAHLAVGVRGRFLVIADNSDSVAALLAKASAAPSSSGATYAAGFCHAAERENLARMVRWMDFPSLPQPAGEGEGEAGREPAFFSGNMTSFSSTLSRVESSSILVRDSGPTVSQTVVYKWKQ